MRQIRQTGRSSTSLPLVEILKPAKPPYRRTSPLRYTPAAIAFGIGAGAIAWGISFWGGIAYFILALMFWWKARS